MARDSHRFGEGGRGGDPTLHRPTDPGVGEIDVVGELREREGR